MLTLFIPCLKCRFLCGNSSVGRARPCQGRGREFESRFPLHIRTRPPSAGPCCFRARCVNRAEIWKNPRAESARRIRRHRPGGRVVMQRTANPRTPVQFRPRPPARRSPTERSGFLFPASCAPEGSRKLAARRPDGGIGRRSGLKIRHPQGYAGSIPAPGTSPSCSPFGPRSQRSASRPAAGKRIVHHARPRSDAPGENGSHGLRFATCKRLRNRHGASMRHRRCQHGGSH